MELNHSTASEFHVIIIAAGCSRRLAEMTLNTPKSFLTIKDKKIIEYILDAISERNFRYVTIVVGYLKEKYINTVGTDYKNLKIDYVTAKDYAETGHAWSIYLTKSRWEQEKRPVFLIHADLFFDPKMLDQILNSKFQDVLGVDEKFEVVDGEEVVVYGQSYCVRTIQKGALLPSKIAGKIIGINKWSSKFMFQLFGFMEEFFEKNGTNYNWEPVIEAFIKQKDIKIYYEECGDFPWININYKEDYISAQNKIFDLIYG